MKIGVITYWNSADNYGQILQCYALQYFLKSRGHDAFLIKYTPITRLSYVARLTILIGKIADNFTIKGIKYHFSKKRKEDKLKQKEETELILKNNELNKERKFDLFRQTYIKSYPREYKSIKELKKHPPVADILICGSDQVWSSISSHDPNVEGWFLHFGDKKTLRIAYAASIGHDLSNKGLKIFRKLLSPFDAISVRESQVKKYAEEVGYKNTSVVLDPTLLFNKEDYAFPYNATDITTGDTHVPYMFIYILNIKTPEEIHYEIIQNYSKAKDLNIKVVTSSGYCPAREILPDTPNIYATIPEWLDLINNAECVVTTSFHGTVFCIIMRKKFIVMPLKHASNERIEHLLKELGIIDRIYNPNLSFTQQMEKDIDWDSVYSRLQTLKEESISFILNSINIKK